MKKIILPLLLILSIGMLAAVESAPSEVVGYVKYDMVIGNNLIAIPMENPYAMASDLGMSFAGNVDQISYWDQTSQAWVTATDIGGFWDGDYALSSGSVLLVYSYAPTTFYSIGDMPATNASYTLVTGNNTLMIPLNKSILAMASDLGAELVAGSVDQISYWDQANQAFSTATDIGGFWDGDYAISIGMPLMVYSYAPITWPTRSAGVLPLSSKVR